MPAVSWLEIVATVDDEAVGYGEHVRVLGAWVYESRDGWRCEHGHGPHEDAIDAAHDCMSNCDHERERIR